MIKRIVRVIVTTALTLVSGCGSQPAKSRPGDITAAPPTVAKAEGLELTLSSVAATMRRSYPAPGETVRLANDPWRIEVTLAIRDPSQKLMYNVEPAAQVLSCVDNHGHPLKQTAPSAGYSGERAKIPYPFPARDGGNYVEGRTVPATRTRTLTWNVDALPASLSELRGSISARIVTDSRSVELPLEAGAEQSLAPGVTFQLREVLRSSRGSPSISAEYSVNQGTGKFDPQGAPLINITELVDASGRPMGALTVQEETVQGGILHVRLGSRDLPTGTDPLKLRVQVITAVREVALPFEFHDIVLAGTPK
jgi:hypothetical protein